MRLDIYHHYPEDNEAARLAAIRHSRIINRLETIMRTLEETLAAVEAETSSVQSISTLLAGIKKQLDDALGGTLTPSQQMRVDAIFNKVQANKQQLDAAIKANDGVTDEDEKIVSVVEAATSASPANVGDTLIFSGHVAKDGAEDAPAPTGTINFVIDGNPVGTGTLDADGVATFTFSLPIPVGDHELRADYSGDAGYQRGQSDPVVQTIVAPGGQS